MSTNKHSLQKGNTETSGSVTIDELKSVDNFEKIMEYYGFEPINYSGNTIRSCCAIHNSDNPTSFVYNMDNRLWFCHSGGCGGGDIFDLIMKMNSCNFKEAKNFLAKLLGYSEVKEEIKMPRYNNDAMKWLTLMQERTKKHEYIDLPIIPLKSLKPFYDETVKHFKISYLKEYQNIRNKIVYPVEHNGITVFYSLRRIDSSDRIKWQHYPKGTKVGNYLYNFTHITQNMSNFVIVCEGITDVLAYHEIGLPAVATFGANLSVEQERMLIRSGKKIYISFDGDSAGIKATKEIINKLKYKCDLGIVNMPPEQDPNSISREELELLWNNRLRTLMLHNAN